MKMCEDYNREYSPNSDQPSAANSGFQDPWVVVAVKDAGPEIPFVGDGCSCQDPTACGCIIIK